MASCPDLFPDLQEELTCPICREYFTNPVSIECGHSFCQNCLFWSCRENATFSCSECKSVSHMRDFQVNGRLGKLASIAIKLRPHTLQKPEGHGKCEVHQEVQKLFCEDDQSPVCMSCSQSQEHKAHTLCNIDEVAECCRKKLKETVNDLWKKTEKVLQNMDNNEKPDMDFLQNKKEVLKKNESLLHKEIEKFCIKKSVCPIPGIIEAISSFKVDITLDRKTAHPALILSEDLKTVSYGGIEEEVPNDSGSSETFFSILGTQSFTSKRYYWEVKVPDNVSWCVGVCKISTQLEGYFVLMSVYENNAYHLYAVVEHHLHRKIYSKYLQISESDLKVGIFFDCDAGEISFYHVREKYLFYTFPTFSFSGCYKPLFSFSKKDLMNDCSLTICL
ncbi:tripartite motif-containing protein 48-like [Dromiciops gliroides]|uniref:tripartite motif-containing protein 48-like n=1 Tax=Dromiciops gliroides TaxID=33562 RepID=UPI001CC4FEBB|nr:tripartite motif-containing protein 48-like [Dromiciops gliroides]